jgi:hypothetical protein
MPKPKRKTKYSLLAENPWLFPHNKGVHTFRHLLVHKLRETICK